MSMATAAVLIDRHPLRAAPPSWTGTRAAAIRAGALIDVSDEAWLFGWRMPVGISPAVWALVASPCAAPAAAPLVRVFRMMHTRFRRTANLDGPVAVTVRRHGRDRVVDLHVIDGLDGIHQVLTIVTAEEMI